MDIFWGFGVFLGSFIESEGCVFYFVRLSRCCVLGLGGGRDSFIVFSSVFRLGFGEVLGFVVF